jgi:hypothetical protein
VTIDPKIMERLKSTNAATKEAARAELVAKFRSENKGSAPSPEELDQYVREIEREYLTDEEREINLQAAADLAKGEQIARAKAQATIKAQKRAFKGIYNRTHFIIWAKQALRREQLRLEAEMEAAEQERDRG